MTLLEIDIPLDTATMHPTWLPRTCPSPCGFEALLPFPGKGVGKFANKLCLKLLDETAPHEPVVITRDF